MKFYFSIRLEKLATRLSYFPTFHKKEQSILQFDIVATWRKLFMSSRKIHLDNCHKQVLFNYEIYSPRHKFIAHNGVHVHGKGIPQ